MSLLLLFGGSPGAIVATGVTIAIGSSAALTAPVALQATAEIRISVDATLRPPGVFAAAGISVSTAAAALTAPVPLRAAAEVRVSTSVGFARPMEASGAIVIGTRATIATSPRESQAQITIDGDDVRYRVRMAGLTIRDILNDAPNTCSLVLEGAAPAIGQRLRVTVNEGSRVLFAGVIQTVDQSFEGLPQHVAWRVTAIDDTAAANARRPFGTWVDTSATTIAQTLTAQFAPAFSSAGIAPDLPAVSITFDGTDTLIAALARLANAIGGYTKIEDGTVYLFHVDPGAVPDPIDAAHRFLHAPPITANTDASQLRTRVYGKGYGEAVLADLAPGETLIPLQNGVTFSRYGGDAIAATTADGAQSLRVSFTGREAAGGGTLVGPGAAPTTAPGVALASGSGVESGPHDYAVVFGTVNGKSLPGPRGSMVVGLVPAPASPITPGAPIMGGALEPGTYRHYAVFKTAAGARTTAGPPSVATTLTQTAAPTLIGSPVAEGNSSSLTVGGAYAWKYTFRRLSDNAETTASPASPVFVCPSGAPFASIRLDQTDAPPAGFVRQWYRCKTNETGGPYWRLIDTAGADNFVEESFSAPTRMIDGSTDLFLQAPSEPGINTTGPHTIPLTTIPVSSSPLVTAVELYRELNHAGAAAARFIGVVANGTTSVMDGVSNASLGALVPSTNTAVGNQVQVSWPAGPPAVTTIEIYRTAIGSATLRLVHASGSNTAGTVTDSTPDASLGAVAPAADTSGLTQPTGQVNPGATAVPVASPAPFRPDGGWVILSGGQVVRYTGISGSTLTGIPAAGAGAIVTTVIYGSPAQPAAILTGVTGLTLPIAKGSAIHIWVQVDDLQAQLEHAARAGGDGVVEYVIVDARRGAESLTARCVADLALFARPLITVTYATRDLKTQSGKQIAVDLASPRIVAVLTIQEVTITEIDLVPNVAPRFTVKASSVRFSLEDTLRRLIAGGPIVGGLS